MKCSPFMKSVYKLIRARRKRVHKLCAKIRVQGGMQPLKII